MNDAPTILITSSLTSYLGEPAFRLSENYADAVIEAGGVPIAAPLTERLDVYRALLDRADGLLLSGGADIDPARFMDAGAGDPASPRTADIARLVHETTPVRDAAELALIAEAERRGMPILGICRGLQIINVAHGGTLFLDLAAERAPRAGATSIAHDEHMDGRAAHEAGIEPGSMLAGIVQADRLVVNSMHHQAIRALGRGMRVAATAPDGVIEAVEVPGQPFELAVQWHPEYLADQAPMRGLFEAFVDAARTYRRGRG